MRELIGKCMVCSKEIFCLDGFFYGILTEEREIYCFDCYENVSKKEEDPR